MRAGLIAACAALAAAAAGVPAAAVAPAAAAAASRVHAANGRCVGPAAVALTVQASTLCVTIEDPEAALGVPMLRAWVERSARIVASYYGRFPAPRLDLRVHVTPGSGVRGGRTTRDSGLMIQVSVGSGATAADLAADWVLVHEMVHLALPEIGRRHNWLAEGLATYVEGVARAQSGNRGAADVWAEYRRSMPLGLPHDGEGGMDETSTWGRTYWGGALFCLQADVAIRTETRNRHGLQTALRTILGDTGGFGAERDIEQVLRIGDRATGTTVLEDSYRRSRAKPLTPDLALLWTRLGVPADPATQPFNDHAPLAAVRIAITAAR